MLLFGKDKKEKQKVLKQVGVQNNMPDTKIRTSYFCEREKDDDENRYGTNKRGGCGRGRMRERRLLERRFGRRTDMILLLFRFAGMAQTTMLTLTVVSEF